MKSTTLALTTLLATAAIAQPHRQHQHQHVKKDVVWHTDWVSVTETVGITTTVWVDGDQTPATSAVAPISSAAPVPASSPTAAVEPAKVASPEPASSSAPAAPAAVVPSVVAPPAEVSSASSSSSIYVAPTTSSSTSVYIAPTTSSSTSVYVAPTTSSSTLAAPTSSASAQASSGSSGSGGDSHGITLTSALTGSGHNGIGTGLVSPTCAADSSAGPSGCGTVNDGTTEKVVALSHLMMGTQSNSGVGDDANPFCGKTVTIVYGGKSTTAKVVDKCGDCSYESIDLSHATFEALTPEYETLGRQQATWYFSD
ncbi:Allergen [Lachnellula occidentalis]|uniref:Allergen n=1 Tax=Lachnellula occidentalis TaxID=215460 RepID=A0A8H8RTU2_9HELO|nr:Allergen [Lachnellula occidentalis]